MSRTKVHWFGREFTGGMLAALGLALCAPASLMAQAGTPQTTYTLTFEGLHDDAGDPRLLQRRNERRRRGTGSELWRFLRLRRAHAHLRAAWRTGQFRSEPQRHHHGLFSERRRPGDERAKRVSDRVFVLLYGGVLQRRGHCLRRREQDRERAGDDQPADHRKLLQQLPGTVQLLGSDRCFVQGHREIGGFRRLG